MGSGMGGMTCSPGATEKFSWEFQSMSLRCATEVCTVKYQEYRIKDPAAQLGILLSLWPDFMEHNFHALH